MCSFANLCCLCLFVLSFRAISQKITFWLDEQKIAPLLVRLLPLFGSLIVLIILHVTITDVGPSGYSYVGAATFFITHKSIGSYLLGWFIAYGPILVLILYNWRRCGTFLIQHSFQATYLVCSSILAWLSGTDTERFLYWAMPVVYILIGRSIIDLLPIIKNPVFIHILAITQSLSQRILWTIPDYPGPDIHVWPIFSSPGSNVSYLDLWSFHADSIVQMISLLEYLLLTVFLLLYLKDRSRLLCRGTSSLRG